VLGLVAVPLNYLVLRRLLAIVETFRGATPLSPRTRPRLQAIAWALLGCRFSASSLARREGGLDAGASLHLQAGFSISGWLAVLLTFLLARVFAEGTHMREDLEGTV